MTIIVRTRTTIPAGVARTRLIAGDTLAVAAAVANETAIAVTGPPGTELVDGSGLTIIGNRIDLNIEELPLA